MGRLNLHRHKYGKWETVLFAGLLDYQYRKCEKCNKLVVRHL